MPDLKHQLNEILKSLDDMQATDVKVLDVSKQTSVTDYMIIASGRSSRHVRSVAQKVTEDMKAIGVPPLHTAGMEQGDWALIDLGDFVIHVMQPECRQFYNIEGLWEEQPKSN